MSVRYVGAAGSTRGKAKKREGVCVEMRHLKGEGERERGGKVTT